MAPEMATGPVDRIGPASDIYLMGATLFFIITGKSPHFGEKWALHWLDLEASESYKLLNAKETIQKRKHDSNEAFLALFDARVT